jgi:hypothetical protein
MSGGRQYVIHSDPDIQGENLFNCLEAGDSVDHFMRSFRSVTREPAVASLELQP